MPKRRKTVRVPTFNQLDPATYMVMKPEEIAEHIENEFNKAMVYCRKTGPEYCDMISLLTEYGIWSRNMNTVLRKRMKENPEDSCIRYAYTYWWNRTHYLETYQKSFFGQISDRKNINNGRDILLRLIMHDKLTLDELAEKHPRYAKMIRRYCEKKELSAEETQEVLSKEV